MTPAEQSALYKTDYLAWVSYRQSLPAEFATKAEAEVAARTANAARARDNVEYGVLAHNDGYNLCTYSND